MADGYEADRTEAYFSGRLKPAPRPRRVKPQTTVENSHPSEMCEKSIDEKLTNEKEKGKK